MNEATKLIITNYYMRVAMLLSTVIFDKYSVKLVNVRIIE